MRLTKLTATLFATTMVAMAALPEATLGAGQVAQHARQMVGKEVTMKEALRDPDGTLEAAAAPGNLVQALTTAVGAAGSVVHGLPNVNVLDRVDLIQRIEAAALVGASAATVEAKKNIRKALGLKFDNPALGGGSPETLQIKHFIEVARASHVIENIKNKMTAGTVDHIRQFLVAPGGAGAGGQIPAFVFGVPSPTPKDIMKAFAKDLNLTIQDDIANGHNPNNADIDAWLTQFGIH